MRFSLSLDQWLKTKKISNKLFFSSHYKQFISSNAIKYDTYNECALNACSDLASLCCGIHNCQPNKCMVSHLYGFVHESSSCWCDETFYHNIYICMERYCCGYAYAQSNYTLLEIFYCIQCTPMVCNLHGVSNDFPIDTWF